MDKFKRRRVKYRLCDKCGHEPDVSDEYSRQKMELYEYKDGWWHTWTQVSEKDSKSDNILIKAYGVIETAEHDLLELPIRWFKFVDDE